MATMSRGPESRPRGPKKHKSGTPSSRRHHFESFSDRIAKLKIEPVRRGRGAILDDAELDTSFSYFKDALTEWRDLNLSEHFTKFARKVAPLCESLPQVLHHSDRIIALLLEHVQHGDKHSEEPLLSLVAHFAHDLGVRFEQHFAQTVTTVAQLAAKHQDVEVIEWSFTCLAWLFKYLSRLLVPDLRPVFDLMAPLLGKEHQKAFVTRFAADSLSFLLRKAGAVYHRDKEPLRLTIRHISEQLKDLQGTPNDDEFQHGLMSLFAESMKGLQRGMHSSAAPILQEMLLRTYDEAYIALRVSPLEPTLIGVVTALIHHSDAANFRPLLDIVIEQARATMSDARFAGLSSRVIFIACGVRGGSRIAEWNPILESLSTLVELVSASGEVDPSQTRSLISALAVAFQYCSMDSAILHVETLGALSSDFWEKYFLPFCDLFAELGLERFKTLLLPYFKKFIAQKAHEYGTALCSILPKLYHSGMLGKGSIQPSARWLDVLVDPFEQTTAAYQTADHLARIAYECNTLLDTFDVLVITPDLKQRVSNVLFEGLKHALEIDDETGNVRPTDVLATGKGFRFLVSESDLMDSLQTLWPALSRASAFYGQSLPFWQALLSLMEKHGSVFDFNGPHKDYLKQTLMRCLGSPSHDIRLAALGILEIIVGKDEGLRSVITIATMIEQTPMNMENQRSVTMRIKQLAKSYLAVSSDEWVGEAVPSFCFGLLHVRLSSVWEDACMVLKTVCETKEGESHVCRIAFEWLSTAEASPLNMSQKREATSTSRRYATEFECTNIMSLNHSISKSEATMENVEQQLQSRFNAEHAQIPFITSFSRTQALRVLHNLPQVAEKRSRLLVPVLLQWALAQPIAEPEDDVSTDDALEQQPSRWSRKDQKAMLLVFSKFNNPKVLFKSEAVYEALLMLLGNGDVEIQKAALKAILTWKDPAITRYQEHLFFLLDDARFREEIAVFLDVGTEESRLQDEHRDQLLPVILRLLYGKVISGKKGLEAKRKAVFIALTRFGHAAIHQFLTIALGPLDGIAIMKGGELDEEMFQRDLMKPRNQLGMLNMIEDMLETLKTTLKPFTPFIVDPLLYCLIKASRDLTGVTAISKFGDDEGKNIQMSMLRTIRQRAFYSLNVLFESCPELDWDAYTAIIIKELVTPRLDKFPTENAQSVSGLLRLFSAWSLSARTALYLVEYNTDILAKVICCLNVPSGKDDVKQFILDSILRNIISLVVGDDSRSVDAKRQINRIHSCILQPYASTILQQVGQLLQKAPGKNLLESAVQTVADLAPHVVGSAESRSMIEIATFLLRQPSRRVNALTKLGLLRVLHEFIPRCDEKDMDELFDTLYDASCSLFAYFKDRTSRAALCDVLQDLANHRGDLVSISTLCCELNSFSTSKLDEPDFDRRSRAFNAINSDQRTPFSVSQCKPLIYNMLYYIRDNEELSIRINASLSLRRCLEVDLCDETSRDFISSAVLPGIQSGVRETFELVRVEFLAVLGQLVKTHADWTQISDLHILLSGEDESSFFNNILHIQGHRRLRALRRLASNAPHLQGGNIYHLLIPLLEHFIFNKGEDDNANNIAGEASRTIATLSEWLEWPQFRSLLKKFIGYLSSKTDMQKAVIKLIAGMMDGLNQAGRVKGYVTDGTIHDSKQIELPSSEDVMDVDTPLSTLSKTLPRQEKLTTDLTQNILPDLTAFLRKKDDTTVSLRVPIAVAVTKVLLVLPFQEIELRLPSVLVDICYILRSRSQDGRDMARNTLAEIATLAGPTYLGFILKALRTALQRGYQLHVLSFTLHHILVKFSNQLNPGEIDYCLKDIIDVILDDTFGVSGQEKDAEEYISKMKEVKSSKSFDSMDIIARTVTPSHLVDIILPIKSLLMQRLNGKMVQKVDELLRRIGLGVLQNPTVKSRDILVLCYELIQDVYKASANPKQAKQEDAKSRRFLIDLRGAAKSGARHAASSHIYKITRFSLDILRTVLRKHEDLQTPQNLAGFLPIIGDAMVQGKEEIQVSAIRLLTTIIKVPMAELDKNCPVYVTEAVREIKAAPSTNTEIAQASLKMISAILRERPNVEVKERDLAQLLKRSLPDLDEPDRQGVIFGFLKAIMNRKIVITEVYEVMDKVAAMMVTNQTKSARDIARSSYFHFLMEYPQAKNRFTKQVEFLIRNLRYEHVEGRQSVMEALNLVLTRVGDNVLQDVLGTMFIPLIHTMANDDSSDCRTMAGALVKKVFERADYQRLKGFIADLRGWLEQDEDVGLKRLGIQCWGLYIEMADPKTQEMSFVLRNLQSTMAKCLKRRDEDDWELVYYSLNVASKLTKSAPDITFAPSEARFWDLIQSCISYPHTWVKLTAAKLLGLFFADLASANGEAGLFNLPLESSRGLQLTEHSMIQLAHAFLKNLTIPNVTEALCIQSVRNVAFLGRCLAVNGAKWSWQNVDDDAADDLAAEEPQAMALVDTAHSDEESDGLSSPPLGPFNHKKAGQCPPTAIHRILTRLSGLLRRETKIMKLISLHPKSATMALLETLCNKLHIEAIASALPHLLTTLSTLTDPATTIPRSTDPAFNDTYKALVDKAREVMDIVQKRLGTHEYLKIMGEVQKGVKQRREDRRTKRKIEAITMPEKHGQEKKRRHEVNKQKRKEKSAENRARRRGW
ncbi:U3 snoRNP protein Utp20 [Massariosphaeria phaeospora]|uniref:U3 snoRNP protein Utp20 n=1 Tax=Massariosphaeria phaeospora TaxID=100035 RepID=A0A7C8IFP4_9PLEO|nr:U3 snoRNP protein Utp20 [Massariosphaeria phaeospora]